MSESTEVTEMVLDKFDGYMEAAKHTLCTCSYLSEVMYD